LEPPPAAAIAIEVTGAAIAIAAASAPSGGGGKGGEGRSNIIILPGFDVAAGEPVVALVCRPLYARNKIGDIVYIAVTVGSRKTEHQ
jgi:hypothetical protein